MKKILFFAFAAAAMVGCSNDEVVDLNQEVIGFGDAFVENSTRSEAYDPSFGAQPLTEFQVWGRVETYTGATTPIFDGDKVTGTMGAGNVWNCEKTQYWIPGANYKFSAIAPVDKLTDELYGGEVGLQSAVFTSDGATDLLYSGVVNRTAAAAGETNAPVDFTFNHMLSRVVFTITNTTNEGNSDNSGFYYQVSNIKFTNANTVGKCAFATAEWTEQATPGEVTFGNAKSVEEPTIYTLADRAVFTSSKMALLIPCDYGTSTPTDNSDDLAVSFDVEIYNANVPAEYISQETVTVKVPVEFEAGHSYNFKINVGLNSPITFSVESAPTWDTSAPDVEL